ncbi:GNAT family N-acetyltransferase [Paenibacillus sp. MY03]|jgi:ribosomal-protein-alanine N-acetyltransferase|uniref:GNAT family N-acetyltransferase n=1 Tax=Paenibacillus sp. MY03 TaxID=302980 RepID=UPI000B3C05C4|nr:GNAT family protein [Paenibacillus sp. MY03]OUS68767.1 GNAT family N-acetyltransferase [Paenibacillus sp. MY03]
MNKIPVIETPRLRLRPLRMKDASDVFHYFARDEVTEYYDVESFTELEQAEKLIQFWHDRFHNQQAVRWGITLRSQDRVIGTCGFHNWTQKHCKAEVGYELSPEYWRQGIMAEALHAIMHFGYGRMALNRIAAIILPGNTGSRRLLEKMGFYEEGTLKEYYYKKASFRDAIIFSKLNAGKEA